jgi:DDE family transposase
MRLVTARVAPTPAAARRAAASVQYELLTDRWDLAADEVVQLYLWRWQIELFFRWLKRYVRLPQLLGYSRNAVELTLLLALLVHLLTVLAAHALGARRRSPTLRARLGWLLGQLTPADLRAPVRSAFQLAFPGWGLPAPLPP